MWSDTLQQAERLHLLRLCVWGGLATLAGTALVVLAYTRAARPALVRRFGMICGTLGLVELIAGLFAYRNVPLRDIGGATRLDRVAWLQLGLFIGLMAVGVTLALASRVMKVASAEYPAASLAGAGVALVLHGLALATLELLLIAQVSR